MNTRADIRRRFYHRAAALVALMSIIIAGSVGLRADTGTCGGQMTTLPFTDVPATNSFFCSIAEAFFSGLTSGTTATTFSPGTPVLREQMAAFVTRTMDQSLKRGSRRASLKQWWTPTSVDNVLALTTVGSAPQLVESDGLDLWVANNGSGTVSRVRASDGKLLETWGMATSAAGVLAAKGRIFVTGELDPGRLYQIDPTQPAAAVTTLSSSVGVLPTGIAFDGTRVWTANQGPPGSISVVSLNPPVASTVTGFTSPVGILYDGANMWVTDGDGTLKKLGAGVNIIQTVPVGTGPAFPVFDGTNIWVPNSVSNSVSVVRAATGTVLATLTGNGLSGPLTTAFDGERILVTNMSGGSVSLWRASDLTPLGFVSAGVSGSQFGACSDGLNFWITLPDENKLLRF